MINTFGRYFRITLFGSSHSPCLGVEIEGCPAGLALSPTLFAADLDRRRAGRLGTTARREPDLPFIETGCHEGLTTGETLRISFTNTDVRSDDYRGFVNQPRPGHADWVARQTYGPDYDLCGGGIFSGRMTLPIVAAGVVAMQILQQKFQNRVQIFGSLRELGGRPCSPEIEPEELPVLQAAIEDGDSIGGIISCCVTGLPVGLGRPFFESMESQLAQLAFSIPGIKGIEFGDGFAAAGLRGSAHNDCFIDADGHTATNHAGGINGGLTNGNELIFRVAVKPTPSIALTQHSFDFAQNKMAPLRVFGRHDTCFALRLPVVIEAVAAIVLADNVTGA
jgi:chorismate synthase